VVSVSLLACREADNNSEARQAQAKEKAREEYERTVLHPPDPPPNAAAAKVIEAATAAKPKMCACKDRACAKGVDDELQKLTDPVIKEHPDFEHDASSKQREEIEAVGKAISDCRDRAGK
jgi:hypothetical protein